MTEERLIRALLEGGPDGIIERAQALCDYARTLSEDEVMPYPPCRGTANGKHFWVLLGNGVRQCERCAAYTFIKGNR